MKADRLMVGGGELEQAQWAGQVSLRQEREGCVL